ncbi:protein EDS1L-like [Tasmannia lanceolata]|uniref:protein EDS1L-like n=1 Tax=Tasmannia lanceolata TaxID=3420 RepID=UPI0040636ABA
MERSRNLRERVGIEEDIIKKSCSLAMRAATVAHQSPPPFLQDTTYHSAHAIFAFPSSWSFTDWFTSSADSTIDLPLFPSLRVVGSSSETAFINPEFLRCFYTIMRNSALEQQVRRAVAERRQLVFTGHSSGGAIAILATLWLLEQSLKLETPHNQRLPFCITFGSPLIGDRIFAHALGRENWSSCFLHFITRYDIIPRMSLSHPSSIQPEFHPILHFFDPNSVYFNLNSIGKSPQAVSFFSIVLRNASSVASYNACSSMGSTNMLLETIPGFVKLSPYRPVGTYIFCTGNGGLVCVRNGDAVLQLLFYSLQLGPEEDVAEIAYRSLKEHLVYGSEVQESLEMQDIVYLDSLAELPLSLEDGSSDEMQLVHTALQQLGLSVEARLCLHAAGESEKQKLRNQAKIRANSSKIEEALKFIHGYRVTCEIRGVGYYDAFKLQKDTGDFDVNIKRLDLAGLWDEIIDMLKRYELPDNFEARTEWVELGTSYRRLVEPLDIANYYRHFKNEDTGPYLINGRPRRYRYTQKWLERAKRMPANSSSESCFWAKVEELCVDNANNKPFEETKGRVLELEKEMLGWLTSGEVGRDVLLEESTFVKWWKTLPQQHQLVSCLAKYMS